MAVTIYSPARRGRVCFPTEVPFIDVVNQDFIQNAFVHDFMKGFQFIFLCQMSLFPHHSFLNDLSLTALLYIKFSQYVIRFLSQDQIYLGNGLILQLHWGESICLKSMLPKNLLFSTNSELYYVIQYNYKISL